MDAPADPGIAQNALTNVVTIQELGPEAANPPGLINTDFSAACNITSDREAPGQGPTVILAAGLVTVGVLRRYRS